MANEQGKQYYKNDQHLKEYFDSLPVELQENIKMTGVQINRAEQLQSIQRHKQEQ